MTRVMRHELRQAEGTKFDLILDSYVYGVVISGGCDDYFQAARGGQSFLVEGKLEELIYSLAREQGIKMSDLGLTPEEMMWLDSNTAVIVLEDFEGRVEVEWFADPQDAFMAFHELKDLQQVRISDAAFKRTFRPQPSERQICLS